MYFTNFKMRLENVVFFMLKIAVFVAIIVVNTVFPYNIYASSIKDNNFYKKEVFLGGQNVCVDSQIDYGLVVISVDETSVDIRPKDIILEIDSQEFCDYNQIGDGLKDKDSIVIKIKRGNDIFDLVFKKEDYIFFQVSEGSTSVTVTFYDEYRNLFAVAGHKVSLYGNENVISNYHINGITKSSKETSFVGSIDGNTLLDNIGTIKRTDKYGAYGSYNENYKKASKEKVVLAGKADFHVGKAKMYCSIDNDGVKAYDVLVYGSSKEYFKIKIIDNELINKTGGIVRGMSGSPIVQDGKLIGAMSNTTLNNPDTGSAIFIDYMANSLYNK